MVIKKERMSMKNEYPLVTIVLSTFNGERYLEEQLNSLLEQTYKNIKIIVRDDGSKDGTCEILKHYKKKCPEIDVYFEHNIGVVGSFFRLLNLAPSEAEYVALCDQDDVWSKGKIERAVTTISGVLPMRSETGSVVSPIMYFCALERVDANLKHLGIIRQSPKKPSLENALVQNVATGCGVVLNKSALQLVKNKDVSLNKIGMHDWWLYQIISAFGLVLYDSTPQIKYRQHGGNVIGSATGVKYWLNRLKRHLGANNREIRNQANELLRVYGPVLPREKYKLISEFLEISQGKNIFLRLGYAIRMPIYRQKFIDNMLLCILVVMGRI